MSSERSAASSQQQPDSDQLTAHSLPLTELREYARTFPSQGGVEIGPWLEKYASDVPAGSAIIELGCWLGAGTAQLALGVLAGRAVQKFKGSKVQGGEIVIHTYDSFKASVHHVKKAQTRGVRLEEGEDTLPRVQQSLARFGAPMVFHKKKITSVKWDGGPIGLYVDDACKLEPVWNYAMATFQPHFIAGKTLLVLMDYHFDENAGEQYAAQKRYMTARPAEFELIEDRLAGTSAAVFLYK
jgi:hypothetical protein